MPLRQNGRSSSSDAKLYVETIQEKAGGPRRCSAIGDGELAAVFGRVAAARLGGDHLSGLLAFAEIGFCLRRAH